VIRTERGFTLVELTIALLLLALMSAVLFGSFGLAGNSVDRGEAKVDASSAMRGAQAFLRANLEEQHALRMRKMVEWPLLFGGDRDEVRYAGALPARVAGGGMWYYRLSLKRDEARSPLVLERVVPDVSAPQPPDFNNAERSILAQDIATLRIAYFGRDNNVADSTDPTWRDTWDDPQRLPALIRIDVVPKRGDAWPSMFVAPRESPEAGCRAWDSTRGRCAQI